MKPKKVTYRLSPGNLPISIRWGLCVIWLAILTKQVFEVPLWIEIPFWVYIALWFVGAYSLAREAKEVDIFERWNE